MPLYLSFLSGIILYLVFPYVPLSAAIIFFSASLVLLLKKRALLVPVILLGTAYAFLRTVPADDVGDLQGRDIRVTGRFSPRVDSTGENPEAGFFIIDSAFKEDSDEEITSLEGEEMRIASEIPLEDETWYDLQVSTGRDQRRYNPGGFLGEQLYGRVTGIVDSAEPETSIVSGIRGLRNRLNEYLLSRFSRDSAALVAAMTTGETGYLSEDLKKSFNRTGLAHILSISGTHFGLFSVVLFSITRFLIHGLPYRLLLRLTMLMTPSQAAALLSLPFMIMYLAISGGSVPAIRSFTMISLFLFGLLIGRKGFWLHSLLFAAVLLVLWEPEVILSLSFQLSFIAVLFIGYSIEREEGAGKGKKVSGWIRDSLRLTLAATIGTLPLVAYHFHYLSLISPLTNLIVAPIIGFGIIPLSLFSSFAYLFSGWYLFAPVVGMLTDLSLTLVRWTSNIPYASVAVSSFPPILIFLFYGFVLIIFSKRQGMKQAPSDFHEEAAGRIPYKLIIIPLIPFMLYALLRMAFARDLAITFLDVGQGDSAVIELPDRRTIVVDAGRTGREVLGFLAYEGIEEIDALVLTHVHPDHTGGLQNILSRIRVREVWDNGRIIYPDSLTGMPETRHLQRGDIIEADGCTITVLHPHEEFYTRDGTDGDEENNASLVLKITGARLSAILAGDIGEEASEDMSHLGQWLKTDVIKVPHHGSDRSLHENLLPVVDPSAAVISVGRDNPYGHPGAGVLEALAGAETMRTDRDGAIKISEIQGGMSIKTYRQFMPAPAGGIRDELRNLGWLLKSW